MRASDVALDWPRGTTFTLHAAGQRRPVRIRLLGRYQVYPALAAVTVALEEGLPLDEVLPRIEAVEAERGRMAMMPLENGAIVVRDEFKSAIETVDAALDVLTEIPARRRIVVLGEVAEAPGSQGPIYGASAGASRSPPIGRSCSVRAIVAAPTWLARSGPAWSPRR